MPTTFRGAYALDTLAFDTPSDGGGGKLPLSATAAKQAQPS